MTKPRRAAPPRMVSLDERIRINRPIWTALILAIALAGAGVAAQHPRVSSSDSGNVAATYQTIGGPYQHGRVEVVTTK